MTRFLAALLAALCLYAPAQAQVVAPLTGTVTLPDYGPRFDKLEAMIAALGIGTPPPPVVTPAPLPTTLNTFAGQAFNMPSSGTTRWNPQNWTKDQTLGELFSPANATMANGDMVLKLSAGGKAAAEVWYGYSYADRLTFSVETTLDPGGPGLIQSPLFFCGGAVCALGEIDIEIVNQTLQYTIHGVGPTSNLYVVTRPLPPPGKHVWSIAWVSQALVVWYLDGVEQLRATPQTVSTLDGKPLGARFPFGSMHPMFDVWATSNPGWAGKYAGAPATLTFHRWAVSK